MRSATAIQLCLALAVPIGRHAPVRAQTCEHVWTLVPPPNASVGSLTAFDDGSGVRLYADRSFPLPGGGTAHAVAWWNGVVWEHVGDVQGYVEALHGFDEGAGLSLFAGGNFFGVAGVQSRSIARFDGASWSSVDAQWVPGKFGAPFVEALCSYDDGTGPALVIAGGFAGAGGVLSDCIVKWDGTTWSGFDGGIPEASIRDMVAWDDGTGHALFVGGYFDYAGSIAAARIAKWDGRSWHALGQGLYSSKGSGVVHDLEVYDDGAGAALYVCGTFTGAQGVPGTARIARWNGARWSAVAPTNQQAVTALLVFDDGVRGPGLIVGGDFTTIGGVSASRIARYDHSGWSNLGDGPDTGWIPGMTRFDEGSTPTLWVSGGFLISPGQYTGLARYQYVCEPCYPDCDGSGALTTADFACFQAKFLAADPAADCNASGTLTVADFGCFQTKFVLGCP